MGVTSATLAADHILIKHFSFFFLLTFRHLKTKTVCSSTATVIAALPLDKDTSTFSSSHPVTQTDQRWRVTWRGSPCFCASLLQPLVSLLPHIQCFQHLDLIQFFTVFNVFVEKQTTDHRPQYLVNFEPSGSFLFS